MSVLEMLQPETKQTPKLAYSIAEISKATGLSENFLRGDENLRKKRFKRRVLVLAEDLKTYLKGNDENENQ